MNQGEEAELIETLWNVNVFAAWDNVEMVKEN